MLVRACGAPGGPLWGRRTASVALVGNDSRARSAARQAASRSPCGVVAAELVGVSGVFGDWLGSFDRVSLGEVEDGHGEESRAA